MGTEPHSSRNSVANPSPSPSSRNPLRWCKKMLSNKLKHFDTHLHNIPFVLLLLFGRHRERYAFCSHCSCLSCFHFECIKNFVCILFSCECMGNWHKGKSCGFVRQHRDQVAVCTQEVDNLSATNIQYIHQHTCIFSPAMCGNRLSTISVHWFFSRKKQHFSFAFVRECCLIFQLYSLSNFGGKIPCNVNNEQCIFIIKNNYTDHIRRVILFFLTIHEDERWDIKCFVYSNFIIRSVSHFHSLCFSASLYSLVTLYVCVC